MYFPIVSMFIIILFIIFSNLEEVIEKFAQLSPQERAKRFVKIDDEIRVVSFLLIIKELIVLLFEQEIGKPWSKMTLPFSSTCFT